MDEPERSRDELGKKKCLPEGKTINILEKEKKKKKRVFRLSVLTDTCLVEEKTSNDGTHLYILCLSFRKTNKR